MRAGNNDGFDVRKHVKALTGPGDNISQYLARQMSDIDPMPGVFAGPLARIQSYLNLLYKAYAFCEKNQKVKISCF